MKQKALKILGVFSFLVVLISVSFSLSSCTTAYYQDRDYVADCLDQHGVPAFNKAKLRTVENFYRSYYANELPEIDVWAEKTAKLYFEDYQSETDESDKNAVTDALLYCFVEATGDRYSFYRTPSQYEDYSADMSGSFYGIGVVITHNREKNTVTVNEVYTESGAEEAGILPGDLIIGSDGNRLEDVGYDKTVEALRDDSKLTVDVTVLRGDAELTFTVTKKELVEQSVRYSIDENKIGYIKISSFKRNTFAQFKEAVDFMVANGAVGIIYDLRSNPGGLLVSVVNMLSYISPDETTIVSFSNNYDKPKKDSDSHSLNLPSVIICNESTASAGELFTSAMRDFDDTFGYFDVTLVGAKTYGKGVMQSSFSLGDGSYLTLTVAYYNPPSGVNYDGVGITPDVEVSDDALRLDVAYEEILKLIK